MNKKFLEFDSTYTFQISRKSDKKSDINSLKALNNVYYQVAEVAVTKLPHIAQRNVTIQIKECNYKNMEKVNKGEKY